MLWLDTRLRATLLYPVCKKIQQTNLIMKKKEDAELVRNTRKHRMTEA